MVATIHNGENEDKRNNILEIAQKRFGMYGLAKTTMQEIANDLGMSKGSLYYYFPDKERLYAAVLEKEQNVFLQLVNEKILKFNEPESMLMEYLAVRLNLFRAFLNLSRFRLSEFHGMKPILDSMMDAFRDKEKEVIKKILHEGTSRNIFTVIDPDYTAALYLTLLRGLFHMGVKNKDLFYLEQDEFSSLQKEAKSFTEIFIKGIQTK